MLIVRFFVLQKHPHARGEDNKKIHEKKSHGETPPRTWGRHAAVVLKTGEPRNTPTHVGKTRSGSHWVAFQKKHPHARGEDGFLHGDLRFHPETPPRTWGRPRLHALDPLDAGNTPTHVGKTTSAWPTVPQSGKHPHARGEDYLYGSLVESAVETPPRTWGRPLPLTARMKQKGNTPTHVGKTQRLLRPPVPLQKHPHARGEDGNGHSGGDRK